MIKIRFKTSKSTNNYKMLTRTVKTNISVDVKDIELLE